MTPKEQNFRLWRAIENYYNWLIEQENIEYDIEQLEGDKTDRSTAYSNALIQLFDFLKEEDLYEIVCKDIEIKSQ